MSTPLASIVSIGGRLERVGVRASWADDWVVTATALGGPADLDGDGVVDGADLGMLLADWAG